MVPGEHLNKLGSYLVQLFHLFNDSECTFQLKFHAALVKALLQCDHHMYTAAGIRQINKVYHVVDHGVFLTSHKNTEKWWCIFFCMNSSRSRCMP
jgi:hypothetical protein